MCAHTLAHTHVQTHTQMHTHACVQGYRKPYRVQYSKLFDEKELIETVFSSIEHIYNFQQDFLKELEAMFNPERIEDSQI